jgi:hypothetical protein
MLESMKTRPKAWTREELEALPLPPMPPKIRETNMKLWMEPTYLVHLEVGEDGLWVAMHGEEIAAADPSLRKVSEMVEHYGPDEILMIHLDPDTDEEIYEIY